MASGRHFKERPAQPVDAGDGAERGSGREGCRIRRSAGRSRLPGRRPRGRTRSRFATGLGILLFLAGVALFLYPTVSEYLAAQRAAETVARAMAAQVADAPSAASGKRAKEGDAAYEYLRAYNERVRAGTAGAVNDPWGLGSDREELDEVGLADGLIGSIAIPAMGETLPLYLGSTREHMAHGATVTAGTSAPLGETDSNVLIAAHRGPGNGLAMFRDIENLQPGDELTIDTLWDTLTYRVVETRTVSPSDVQAVGIQPGRDMVTLLTCHPYGHNYQRYLVYCERVEDAGSTAATEGGAAAWLNPLQQALAPSSSPVQVAERWLRVAGLALIVLVPVVVAARAVRRA